MLATILRLWIPFPRIYLFWNKRFSISLVTEATRVVMNRPQLRSRLLCFSAFYLSLTRWEAENYSLHILNEGGVDCLKVNIYIAWTTLTCSGNLTIWKDIKISPPENIFKLQWQTSLLTLNIIFTRTTRALHSCNIYFSNKE